MSPGEPVTTAVGDAAPAPDGVPLGAGALPAVDGPDPVCGRRAGWPCEGAGLLELFPTTASGTSADLLAVLNGCPYGTFTAASTAASNR
jgi:hypothetical protein